MQEKRYIEAKKEIRSVLLTYQESVSLEEFLKTYKGLLGERLPSRTLGFSSDIAFLQSMPDVVQVNTDSYGKAYLSGIADQSSQHIQKLVSKQRKSKPTNKKLNKRQPVRKLPDTSFSVRELPPFLPGTLRAEILQLMAMYKRGVTLSVFALAYRRKFNKYLPLVKGLDTLEGMIKQIPDLEVKTENNERVVYHRNSLSGIEKQEVSDSNKDESSSEQTKDNKVFQEKISFNIHESGIADDVLQSFQVILQKCPDGILDIHFPPLYENLTGKSFDLHELGYNSMAELVDALPHLFKRILNPNNDREWIILPANASVKHSCKAENSSSSHKKQSTQQHRDGIPADVSSPVLQYIQPALPDYINLNEYIPVFVSAIINPSLFWFQLQTDEAIEKFEKFEKDMGYFYNFCADTAYQMQNVDIAIGATCVIQCPDDKQWYRAVIKSIPSTDLVNVLYVDYGSRENVPRANVYYVRSKYHEYPACAFKAQLMGLKPPKNVSSWNIQTQKRFVQLCDCATLMAYIMPIDKDTYTVNLCDTSGDTDIHINDTLVNEGYAELCLQTQSHVNSSCSSNGPETISNGNGIPFDSGSDLSSRSDQYVMQSDNSELSSDSNVLLLNRRLSFSTKEQCNGVASHFEKGQESKRYVKLLELCEDYKIRIINLESKLFMSCGDLCRLIWSEKKSSFLRERLKYKEVDIPFLTIKEEDYVELFRQCKWYKISDFEELDSCNSLLILCSLEESFNVLNIFGHPSVCLRLAIQNEVRSFDPHDPIWKEFCYEKSSDLDDIEKDIQQKLSKLCIYDLKAKKEALKIKRLKLLRVNPSCTSDEMKRIENLQSVIARRIKQIEAICTQYSNC